MQDCEPVAPPLAVQFAMAPPSVALSFASAIGSPVHDPAKWPAYSVSQFSDSKVCGYTSGGCIASGLCSCDPPPLASRAHTA